MQIFGMRATCQLMIKGSRMSSKASQEANHELTADSSVGIGLILSASYRTLIRLAHSVPSGRQVYSPSSQAFIQKREFTARVSRRYQQKTSGLLSIFIYLLTLSPMRRRCCRGTFSGNPVFGYLGMVLRCRFS